MATTIKTEPVPLRVDEYGAIRVGNTRVTLDIVIGVFLDGMPAEEIATEFDTLDLGDVYYAIGYYLHHKAEVHQYLREREQEAQEVWAKIEARQGTQEGLRERLLARLNNNNSQ